MINSSETSVLTRAKQRNVPEDAILFRICKLKIKKAISLIDRGGPYDCEMWRIPRFLENRLEGGCGDCPGNVPAALKLLGRFWLISGLSGIIEFF
jgi:hypothetical protein